MFHYWIPEIVYLLSPVLVSRSKVAVTLGENVETSFMCSMETS